MAGKINPSRMACREQSRKACIIALLPAGAADRLSMNLVRVGSGYEAAAELLSGPVSALLVDLGMLQAAHAGLLKLATGLNVPVVAFGTVSVALDGSALAGVRLVGAEEVPETLREIMNVEAVETGEAADDSLSGRFVAEESPCLSDKPLTMDELDALLRD